MVEQERALSLKGLRWFATRMGYEVRYQSPFPLRLFARRGHRLLYADVLTASELSDREVQRKILIAGSSAALLLIVVRAEDLPFALSLFGSLRLLGQPNFILNPI